MSFAFIACDDDDDNNNNPVNEICDNQVDDDGDGLVDCLDVDDCATHASCQAQVEDCTDGVDNDGDELIDCADDDCANTVACPMLKHITVIGTSDLHSHLMGVGSAYDYSPLTTGDDDTKSGLARIASVINNIRSAKDASGIPHITVDSGDFLMGDMVDFLSGTQPPVMHFFKLMGYDSVTLGNHDFDWTPGGTAFIINAAVTNPTIQFDIPLLSANIVTDATSTADDGIEALIAGNIIRKYVIKEIDDDFSVGIYGVMGIEADTNVPQAAPVTWWHEHSPNQDDWDTTQYQALINEIEDAGANMIINAGHAGSNSDTLGEDRDIAGAVDGIDVIMSGHRHQLIDTPDGSARFGETVIIATGRYGENVSQLDLTFNLTEDKLQTGHVATIHKIDDTVAGDPVMAAIMDGYITAIDEEVLLPNFGMTYSATPIAHTTFDVKTSEDIFYAPSGTTIGPYDIESPAGMLIADAQRATMNGIIQMAGSQAATVLAINPDYDFTPVSYVFIETGAVRDPIMAGNTGLVTTADAFRMFPLGIGPDMLPGYPMLTFYLTPKEIGIILNMNTETFSGNVPFEYYMVPSGLRYIYNEDAGQFNKVRAVVSCPLDNIFTTIDCLVPTTAGGTGTILDLSDETTLIRVSVDYYVALLLPQARNAIGENLTIDPKDKNGNIIIMSDPIAVAGLRFDASPWNPNLNEDDPPVRVFPELKAWISVIQFIVNLPDAYPAGVGYSDAELIPDNIPSIPRRIYDAGSAPAGEEGNWNLGVFRNMEETPFCSSQFNPAYGCGDGVALCAEACDSNDFRGQVCVGGGTLVCSADCSTIDTSGCCVDNDNDTYGVNCDAGPDSDDNDNTVH